MQVMPEKYIFTIGEKIKTTRPGKHLAPIELEAYNEDEKVCVVSHLRQYLTKTAPLRGECSKLLIVTSSHISQYVIAQSASGLSLY